MSTAAPTVHSVAAPDLRIGAHLEPIEDPRSYEDAHDF